MYSTRRRLWKLLQRQRKGDYVAYIFKVLPAAQRVQLSQLFLADEATSAALASELEACLQGRTWADGGMEELMTCTSAGLGPSQALLQGWVPDRHDDEPEALPVGAGLLCCNWWKCSACPGCSGLMTACLCMTA